MRYFMSCIIPVFIFLCVSRTATAQPDEVNVALSCWGTTAAASSEFGPDYQASNAIDGLWLSREKHKWNSANNIIPHWLRIDFNRPVTVHRIVVRHEGVYSDGAVYNTRDYRLESADSPEGPWEPVVTAVTGNTDDVNTLDFPSRTIHHLRLSITKSEQNDNGYARIFEVEAWAKTSTLTEPLATFEAEDAYKRRNPRDGSLEIRGTLSYALNPDIMRGSAISIIKDGNALAEFTPGSSSGSFETWLPIPNGGGDATVSITITREGRITPLKTTVYHATEPSWFADGILHLISSSHQDIAWMDSPERCIEDRDRLVITPALERMREKPEFRFVMESTMNLMEYLDRHPDRKEEIARYTAEGRFGWGATYNQPYESMYDGEALIRQTYLGRRWIMKTLPECDSRTAWSPDVPGRAMQMPQILAKSGIRYLVMSRHEKGFYRWGSPDGSAVTAYSPGHYHSSGEIFRKGIERSDDHTTIRMKAKSREEVAPALHPVLAAEEQYYRKWDLPKQLGIILSTDFSGPVDFDDLITDWNSAVDSTQAGNSGFPLFMPRLRYSTATEFLDILTADKPSLDTIVGERPNVWLYIHGPTHHKALAAGREAWRLLTAAETFAAIDGVVKGSMRDYPSKELETAWKEAIYPDHGWGGYQGAITDRLFRTKMESGRDRAREMLNKSVTSIASRIAVKNLGTPVHIFNPMSVVRSDPVTVTVNVEGGEGTAIRVVDALGENVSFQDALSGMDNETDEARRIVFIAQEVPSLGYKTYYVMVTGDDPASTQPLSKPANGRIELANDHYAMELVPGGIGRLFDRETGREVLQTGKFLGGELFTMHSQGNGAGEFANVQQPDMEGFVKMSDFSPQWSIVEDGPVRTVCEMSGRLPNTSVRELVTLYHTIKRIDLAIALDGWDGSRYREFRCALPLAFNDATVAYQVPMGVVEVGKSEIAGAAGERYVETCAEVHPREVQDWFGATDGGMSVIVSSDVSVFDWIDPTDEPVDYPILQPILLASRRSCHGEGNWYLQAGDHDFQFSITSRSGDWRESAKNGSQPVRPLIIVEHPESSTEPVLPESMSFCGVDSDGIVVSTIKKCEDDDSVIVRFYESWGKSTHASVSWFSSVDSAAATDMLEFSGTPIATDGSSIRLTMGHHSIETIKLNAIPWKADPAKVAPPQEPAISPESGVYIESSLQVTITNPSPGTVIRYTTDGSEPRPNSSIYTKPLQFDSPVTIRARSFRDIYSASTIAEKTYRIGLSPASDVSRSRQGLLWEAYSGSWDFVPAFDSMTPLSSGITDTITNTIVSSKENYGIQFNGYINIAEDGIYLLSLESDDGAKLFIDDMLVADNDGLHWPETVTVEVALQKGFHKVLLDYFQKGGDQALALGISGPGLDSETDISTMFFHTTNE